MDKVLDQDEIDALMKGMNSGDVDTSPKEEAPPAAVTPYSFGTHERVVRGRMGALDIIHDRFSKLLAVTLSRTLHCPADVAVKNIETVKFGVLVSRLPLPSSLTVFKIEPLRGHALLAMDASLVYLLTDHYFGGSAQTHVKPEGRDFTPVQQRILRNVAGLALQDFEKAWKGAHPVRPEIVRIESNPQFAMVVTGSELATVITLRLEVGDASKDFFLCYPYSMLEPIKEKLYAGFISDQFEGDQHWPARLREEVHYCPLEVSIDLGEAFIRVEDLMHFAPGDVVVLGTSPGDPLAVSVEGIPKFHGRAGTMKGQKALQVIAAIKAGDPASTIR